MFELDEKFIFLFYFFYPAYTYFWASIGTKRHLTYEDPKKASSKYDKMPCKLIRKHFKLPKKTMHIETYIFLIFQYILFWNIFVTPLVGFLSGFNTYVTIVLGVIYIGAFIVYAVIMVIVHCFFVPKIKIKKKKLFKGLKHEMEIAETLFSRYQFEWVAPLLNKLHKFEHKQKGVKYIPLDSVKHIEKKILIPNKKHVYYEVKADEHGRYDLLVYTKKDNRIIFESPVRKK